MAEALLFMIGEQMLSKVISLAADEISLAWGFKDDLLKLEENLDMVKSLIYDASSNNKTQDRSVQAWLKGLNKIASEAEAVLDEYSYETLRLKIENRKRDRVLSILSVNKNSVLIRLRLAHTIRKVNLSLDESCKKATQINLVKMVVPTTIQNNERLEHPFIDESSVVGRDVDVEKVIDMLCGSGNDDLSVIAITGIGGQGKTTLAKLVYKHDKVLKHFHKLIWITVSDSFDGIRLLKEMIESLTGEKSELENVEAIINTKLSPELQMKRYLLVLDDVWNEDCEIWRHFKEALLGIKADSGSRILTTTRNDRVASTMNASFIHWLQQLSDEQSWTIFKQRAFAEGGAVETEVLVRIGKEIVKKCRGLPLAIKVIGSLMFSKTFENEWLAIQNSELWNLNDYTKRVLQSLKLSYDHLSFPLKRCFSFCTFYPKDWEIEKDELIQCWMALGLLQPSLHGGLKMEDVGEMYFKTLISCSLLEDARKDEVTGITLCKMHDIVHDLALETVKTDYSILNSQASVSSEVDSELHLRVLVMNYGYRLPDSIKKLKHLRYLDISRIGIWVLPKSITKLYNLQVIKMKSLELESVPKGFTNLINMRHLYVDELKIWGYGKDSMSVMKYMSRKLTSLTSCLVYGYNGYEFQSVVEEVLVNNNTTLRKLCVFNSMHFGLWLQQLTALTLLELRDLGWLESLPDWLGNLSSLQSLALRRCYKLKYLPSAEAMGRLTKLDQLLIDDCPLLESRCKEGTGPEWIKISHIPNITIGGHAIRGNITHYKFDMDFFEKVIMASKIRIQLHHSGKFQQVRGLSGSMGMTYVGGVLTELHNIDTDFISYFEILDYVKEQGHKGLCKLYFKSPLKTMDAGLVLLYNDNQIPALLEQAKPTSSILIFVEHLENIPILNVQGGTDNVQCATDNVQVDEIPYEVLGDIGDEGNKDGHIPLGTDADHEEIVVDGLGTEVEPDVGDFDIEFDDFDEVNSMDHCSEDEDEELQTVRKKLLKMKKDMDKLKKENAKLAGVNNDPLLVDTNNPAAEAAGSVPATGNVHATEGGYDSENLGSTDCDTPTDSEDEDSNKPKVHYPIFNPQMDIQDIRFEPGLRFSNPMELKEAVRNYAVAKALPLKFKKNNTKQVQVICKKGCPWMLFASWMSKEKSFQIKSVVDIHTCPREDKPKMATSTWLAEKYGHKIRMNPTWRCKDFAKDVNDKYKITVTRLQCYRAKKKALGGVDNGLIDHYSHLRSYAWEILRSDRRNTVKLSVHRFLPNEPAFFKRMYVCFYALKKGWNDGCRPVLGLDGSFLKSYCCGEILAAVGRDANNQMFPLAWAVVEVESTDSWRWFLEILKDDLDISNEGNGLTLITDQQKGLDNPIAEIFPYAEHRCCARHIYSNLRKHYTGTELKKLFWQAAKSSTPQEYDSVMKQIKVINIGVFEWISRHNPKLWCRGFFSFNSKCDLVDNNLCECFNGTIIDARYKPIIDMLEEIRTSVKERIHRRRIAMEGWEGEFCPRILDRLDKNIADHRGFCTTYNGNGEFEVRMGMDGYVVDTKRRSCSCRMWELSGIPCIHAVSAIYFLNDEPRNYIHDSLRLDKYKLAYNECMSATNGNNMWPKDETDPILPPPHRRMPGRPQKARRKGVHEENRKSSNGKIKLRGAGR